MDLVPIHRSFFQENHAFSLSAILLLIRVSGGVNRNQHLKVNLVKISLKNYLDFGKMQKKTLFP
jgi:hypothetical protein